MSDMPKSKLKTKLTNEHYYEMAYVVRHRADIHGDPELYELAAALFMECEFTIAARRCRERAKYLRDVQGSQPA